MERVLDHFSLESFLQWGVVFAVVLAFPGGHQRNSRVSVVGCRSVADCELFSPVGLWSSVRIADPILADGSKISICDAHANLSEGPRVFVHCGCISHAPLHVYPRAVTASKIRTLNTATLQAAIFRFIR
jgi:hypothetical protein